MIRTLEEVRRNRVGLLGIDVSAVTKKLGDHSAEIVRRFDRIEAELVGIRKVLEEIAQNTRKDS